MATPHEIAISIGQLGFELANLLECGVEIDPYDFDEMIRIDRMLDEMLTAYE